MAAVPAGTYPVAGRFPREQPIKPVRIARSPSASPRWGFSTRAPGRS